MVYYRNSGGNVGNRYTVTQPYYRRTIPSYEEEENALLQQKKLFEVERDLENDLVNFRGVVEMYMAGRISLGDVLDAMMSNGLCQKIGVWSSLK